MIEFVSKNPLHPRLQAIAEPLHGGFMLRAGGSYEVFLARGDYLMRQDSANRVSARLYIEQHLNAVADHSVNYAMANLAREESTGRGPAGTYLRAVAELLGAKNAGVHVGPSNSAHVRCPAFLAEPGFISNRDFARTARTGEGIDALARCIVRTVRTHVPQGGVVALSVGHAYQTKRDPGAPVYFGDDAREPDWSWEAQIADAIVNTAAEQLCEVP